MLLLIFISSLLFYLRTKEEIVIIEISSGMTRFEKIIQHKANNVKTLKWYAQGTINDTIILNGGKIPPSKFNYESAVNEYYGYPPPKLFYDPFKATDVNIKIKYVFGY